MTRNKGLYRFRVPAWRIRHTQYWTQAELDYAAEEAEKLALIWMGEHGEVKP